MSPEVYFQLLESIAAFFSIRTVLVCVPGGRELDDQVLSQWQQEARYHTGTFFQLFHHEAAESVRRIDDELMLVSCRDVGQMKDLIPALGLGAGVVWVATSEQQLLPPAGLRLDSIWIALETLSDGRIVLTEHYRIKRGPLRSGTLGTWSEHGGLSVPEKNVWERRSDFGGVLLRNSVLSWPPLNDIKDDGRIEGYVVDILRNLQASLNFTVTTGSPEDGEWGVQRTRENGSTYFSGIVGDLARGDADLSASGINILPQRQIGIDYTIGVFRDLITINMEKPSLDTASKENINLMAYLTIFTKWTWTGIVLSSLIIGIAYFVIIAASNSSRDSYRNFATGFVFFWTSLCHMSFGGALPSLLSVRVLLISSALFGIFVYEVYNSDLTAQMTLGSTVATLNNFQDVLDHGYQVHTRKGSSTELLLATAPEGSAMKRVYEENLKVLILKQKTKTIQRVAVMLEDPKNVIFQSMFVFINDTRIKSLVNFEEKAIVHGGIGLQKDSEFKNVFDYHIIKMKQSGLLSQWYHKWMQHGIPGDMTHRIFVQASAPLGFANLFFPALVFLLGVVGGVLALLLEAVAKMTASASAKY